MSKIDLLIAESKKRKAERQQVREETQTLTEELDKDLKELFPIVSSDSKRNEEEVKPNRESYDVLVRELKFEAVGRVSIGVCVLKSALGAGKRTQRGYTFF